MKTEGYGAGYVYDHDTEAGFSGQDYFPAGHGARDASTTRPSAATSAGCAKGFVLAAAAR